MFGNAELLEDRSVLWKKVVGGMRERGEVRKELVLRCQMHPETETRIREPSHFRLVGDGGCNKPCECQLDCGHACRKRCHRDSHDLVSCPMECNAKMPACHHVCASICHGLEAACPPCGVWVNRGMPGCGHGQEMRCHVDVEDHECKTPCNVALPCGHPCPKKCAQPHADRCLERVSR